MKAAAKLSLEEKVWGKKQAAAGPGGGTSRGHLTAGGGELEARDVPLSLFRLKDVSAKGRSCSPHSPLRPGYGGHVADTAGSVQNSGLRGG